MKELSSYTVGLLCRICCDLNKRCSLSDSVLWSLWLLQ